MRHPIWPPCASARSTCSVRSPAGASPMSAAGPGAFAAALHRARGAASRRSTRPARCSTPSRRAALGCELVEADALVAPARRRLARRGLHRAGARVRRRPGRGAARGRAGRAARRRRARGRHRLGHAGLQRRRSRARAPRRAGLGRRQARRLGRPAPARLADRRGPRARGSLRRRARRDGVGRRHVHRAQLAVLPPRRSSSPGACPPPISRASRPRSTSPRRTARSTGASCGTPGGHACRAEHV